MRIAPSCGARCGRVPCRSAPGRRRCGPARLGECRRSWTRTSSRPISFRARSQACRQSSYLGRADPATPWRSPAPRLAAGRCATSSAWSRGRLDPTLAIDVDLLRGDADRLADPAPDHRASRSASAAACPGYLARAPCARPRFRPRSRRSMALVLGRRRTPRQGLRSILWSCSSQPMKRSARRARGWHGSASLAPSDRARPRRDSG